MVDTVACTTTRPQLSKVLLHEDILGVILAELPREDLKSASLVNRNFAVVSRSHVLQVLVLDVQNEEKCRHKLKTLHDSPILPGYVRKLVIVTQNQSWYSYVRGCYDGPPSVHAAVLDELQKDVLDGLFNAGLIEVRWEAAFDMPSALIEAIQITFPMCDFVLERYACAPLPPMPNLISLTATVHCHCDPVVHFQPILRHSPRLRHLEIQAYVHTGCVMQAISLNDDQHAKPFLTGNWDEPICGASGPFLESLVLEDERWSQEGAVKCIADMSWLHLRRLELLRCDASCLLQACAPVSSIMPALEVFKYTTWDRTPDVRTNTVQALREFLATANGLHEIHIEGPYRSVVRTIAETHGKTLHSLILHDHERPDTPQRAPMCISDLLQLGQQCLLLQHLGIDVDEKYRLLVDPNSQENRRWSLLKGKLGRGDPTPRSLATILNHSQYFPALRKVTLYSLLGIARPAEHLRPRRRHDTLDVLKARVPLVMFPDIGDKSTGASHEAAKIRTIVVRLGEDGRQMGGGYPANWVIWEQSNHTVVTLKVTTDGRPDTLIDVAHDDGPHSCVLSDQQPIAWIVTRGNRWVVTKNAPTWEEYLASDHREGVII